MKSMGRVLTASTTRLGGLSSKVLKHRLVDRRPQCLWGLSSRKATSAEIASNPHYEVKMYRHLKRGRGPHLPAYPKEGGMNHVLFYDGAVRIVDRTRLSSGEYPQ